MAKSRLDWTDMDWANYLNCPVQKIPEYKKILDANFLTAIERDRETGKYSFVMYQYAIAPSGFKRLQLILSDDKHKFNNLTDAVRDANNVISTFEFTDFKAKMFDMPKKALQMLLIRQK